MIELLHDAHILLIPVGVILVACAVGWGVIGLFPPNIRDAFTPAAPAVGIAAFIVAAHAVGLVAPMSVGTWILLAIALAFVAVRVIRGRFARHTAVRHAVLIALPLALALGSVIVALQPSFRIDNGYVEHPTPNHDAFWYVTNARWVKGHRAIVAPRASRSPSPTAQPPSDASAAAAFGSGFRIGESFVQSAVTTADGIPLYRTWLPTTAAWLLLVVGGCMALASVLGARRWIGAIGGIGAAGAGALGYQVLNQNGASVLALALTPTVLAAVLGAVKARGGRVPVWVAAVLLAGLAGTYSELLALLGPALLLAFVFAGGRVVDNVKRFAAVGVLSLVIAPLAWYNTARTLTLTSGSTSAQPGHPFRTGQGWLQLSRYTGTVGIFENAARPVAALLVLVAVAAGLAGLYLHRRLRPLALLAGGYLALSTAFVVKLVRAQNDYTLERTVMLGESITLLLAAIGIAGLANVVTGSTRRRWRRRSDGASRGTRNLRVAAPAVALVAVVGLAIVQAHTVLHGALDDTTLASNAVRPELIRAARTAKQVGGKHGERLLVSSSRYDDRLWLADILRTKRQTAWAQLTLDYFTTVDFVGPKPPRWYLIDDGGWFAAPAGQQFGSYRLVDAEQGPVTQVVPVGATWQPDPNSSTARVLSGTGALSIVRSMPTTPLQLRTHALAAGDHVTITSSKGTVLWSGNVGTAEELIIVHPPDLAATQITVTTTSPLDVAAVITN